MLCRSMIAKLYLLVLGTVRAECGCSMKPFVVVNELTVVKTTKGVAATVGVRPDIFLLAQVLGSKRPRTVSTWLR